MKLADLRRLPIGTELRLVECLAGPVPIGSQLRKLKRVQSNALIFTRPEHPDPHRESYLYLPKAVDFRDDGDGGFTIMEGDVVAARYEPVRGGDDA